MASLPFPLDKWTPAVFSHLEDPARVWISLDEEREEIMKKLDKCATSLEKTREVEVGSIIATTFSVDGCLYRAQVLSIKDEDVEVVYCDFGNTEIVKMFNLLKLPNDLANTAPVAMKVVIDGNEGFTDNEKNRSKVESKLDVDDLKVKLSLAADGSVLAKFAAKDKVSGKDKKIRFHSQVTDTDSSSKLPITSASSESFQEVVTSVEVPKSKGKKLVMCSELPALKLLEKVETSGTIVHVSAIGTVWFTPSWIISSLDELDKEIEDYSNKKGLAPMESEHVSIGILCIARNGSDGRLYRARIVDQMKNSVVVVKYIDYGDNESIPVANVFYLPPGLQMLAPAAAEIVLARTLPAGADMQTVLEETLMDKDIVLVLEEEETGVKVGKFFENGKEIKWDEMIDAKKVFSKDDRNMEETEDVVVESESAPPKNCAEKPPTDQKDENLEANVKKAPSSETKLSKVVPPVPLAEDLEHSVFLVHFESVSKVWVCRVEDEQKVENRMDRLAQLKDLTPTSKFRRGAVFGCTYSADGDLYRAVLVDKEPDSKVKIQFIDFGNTEIKGEKELFCIPEDLALEPSAAVPVQVFCNLEDNEENRRTVEDALNKENITVLMKEGKGVFKSDGKIFDFCMEKSNKVTPSMEKSNEASPKSPKKIPKPSVPGGADIKQESSIPPVSKKDLPATKMPACLPDPSISNIKLPTSVPREEVPLTVTEKSERITTAEDTITAAPLRANDDIEAEDRELSKSVPLASEVHVKETDKSVGTTRVADTITAAPRIRANGDIKAKDLELSKSVPLAKDVHVEEPENSDGTNREEDPENGVLLMRGNINVLKGIEEQLKGLNAPPTPSLQNTDNTSSKCFSKAISELKSQVPKEKDSESPRDKKISRDRRPQPELLWRNGDVVTVKCRDGCWRNATVLENHPSEVLVSTFPNNEEIWMETKFVRPSCLPTDALNLIDKDINCNSLTKDREGSSENKALPNVEGKVRDWMDKNLNVAPFPCPLDVRRETPKHLKVQTKKLPEGLRLVEYCKTNSGSLHVQSVLTTSNTDLARNILHSLLQYSSPFSLLTGQSSSYVIQKLVSVLPSSDLGALHRIILRDFAKLSRDKIGTRVVQFMLEFCDVEQQRQISGLVCGNIDTLMTLALDAHGTYVAQACLSHLIDFPDMLHTLVMSVIGKTTNLAQHQSGTFFLQKLVSVLNHFPSHVGLHLLYEDVLANFDQLVTTEPGSRFVQEVLKDCPQSVFLRVVKWIEDNLDTVIESRPTVFVALSVIDQIVTSSNEDESWRILLEKLMLSLVKTDRGFSKQVPLLISAAYHPSGYLLARDVVAKLNNVSEAVKRDVMMVLAENVDKLKLSKTGGFVLKGLEAIIN